MQVRKFDKTGKEVGTFELNTQVFDVNVNYEVVK